MAYEIVWEFRVPEERTREFEIAYGAGGPWAQLLGKAEGFIEVRLLRCTDQPGTYLTVDRWRSREAFEAFHTRWKSDYDALDKHLEGLATEERRLGAFVAA